MALKSMTGYGEGRASSSGTRILVELSSVNRKQLDVQVTLPRGLTVFEGKLHALMRDYFSRGRVSGSVRLERMNGSSKQVQADIGLARSYAEALQAISKALKLDAPIDLDTVARMPDVLQLDAAAAVDDELEALFLKAVEKALRALKRMRAAEGKELEVDLRGRLDQLESLRVCLEQQAPRLAATYRERLLERLSAQGFDALAADERIIREVALFADRCDITEELTRLQSHLKQMRSRLRSREPAGRPLDFLCQELFREINTIGAKATDSSITQSVVTFKTELERIREQVQNVE